MPKTLLYKCWVCSNIAQFGKKSVCYNWCSGRSVDNVFPPLDTPPFVFTSKIVVEKNKAFWEAKNIDLFAKQIIEGFIIWHFHNKWKLQYQFLPDGKFKPAKCAWSSHSQTNGSPWQKKVDVAGWVNGGVFPLSYKDMWRVFEKQNMLEVFLLSQRLNDKTVKNFQCHKIIISNRRSALNILLYIGDCFFAWPWHFASLPI